MGVEQLMKSKFSSMRKNNTTNARALQVVARRATDVAKDTEVSKDAEKVKRLIQSCSNLEMQFQPPQENNVLDALKPIQHTKRAAAIFEVNKQLDDLKPPEQGQEEKLRAAMKKDYEGLKKDFNMLIETTAGGLRQIYELLPSKKDIADNKKWSNEFAQIVDDPSGVEKMEEAMKNVLQKMEEIRESGPLDAKVTIAIVRMDEHDSDVKNYLLDPQQTFGELACTVGFTDDDDEEYIPEFWIKTVDHSKNMVTKSGEVWEVQPVKRRLQEAVEKAMGSDGKNLKVSIVLQDGDYIIALVKDDMVEHTRSIELNSKKGMPAKQYLATKFCNKNISRVCNLDDGSDAANKLLDKKRFEPRTNSLYVELAST